jgi:hypothetical protein
MKGTHIHLAQDGLLQFFQDRFAAEWPTQCQGDNGRKKNDYHWQRNTDYKFPCFLRRRGNDHLLHLSVCELQVFEASNRVWVANSLRWQEFLNAAKLRGCTNLDAVISLHPR